MGAIKAIAAVYGTGPLNPGGPGVTVNVTDNVNAKFDQGNDDVDVTPAWFGIEDPDPNVLKHFGMLYTINGGEPQAVVAKDFDHIELVS